MWISTTCMCICGVYQPVLCLCQNADARNLIFSTSQSFSLDNDIRIIMTWNKHKGYIFIIRSWWWFHPYILIGNAWNTILQIHLHTIAHAREQISFWLCLINISSAHITRPTWEMKWFPPLYWNERTIESNALLL